MATACSIPAIGWMTESRGAVHIIVTDFGEVRISQSTLMAMDARFPGWRDKPVKGRTRAVRHYNRHAAHGKEMLERVAMAIAELTYAAGQDFEQI